MVADVHRTLVYGGIFLYPANRKSPKGKVSRSSEERWFLFAAQGVTEEEEKVVIAVRVCRGMLTMSAAYPDLG